MKILLVYPNIQKVRTPQMGILSIASYLLEKGFDTRICDLTFISQYRYLEHLFANIEKYRPDMIGVSCRSMEFQAVKELLLEIKRKYRNILLVAGGPHATFAPDEIAPFADYLVIGEGEEAIEEVAEAVADNNRQSIVEIQNVAFLRNGVLVKNPLRPLIDLSSLPVPTYELFDDRHYLSHSFQSIVRGAKVTGVFEGSRGCPFSCAYCSNKKLREIYRGRGRWRREKPAELLRNEIDAFKSIYGLDMMYFIDEVIMTSDARTQELKEKLQDINTPFIFMERPEFVNETRVKNIRDAGAYSCSIGIESGNEQFRFSLLGRRMSDETVKRAFQLMKLHGIKTHTFTMMGLPGQTKEIMMETYRLLEEIQPDSAQATIFFPLPGTDLEELVLSSGLWTKNLYPASYYKTSWLNYSNEHKRDIEFFADIINLNLWKRTFAHCILAKISFALQSFPSILYKLYGAYLFAREVGPVEFAKRATRRIMRIMKLGYALDRP